MCKFGSDALQSAPEEMFRATQPDSQVTLDSKMAAGHDERVLVHSHHLGNLDARLTGLISHQADGAGFRFYPTQPPTQFRHPFANDWQVGLQNSAGTGVASLPIGRFPRRARDSIVQFVRPDGQVVVLRPAVFDNLLGADDPTDADSRDAVSL